MSTHKNFNKISPTSLTNSQQYFKTPAICKKKLSTIPQNSLHQIDSNISGSLPQSSTNKFRNHPQITFTPRTEFAFSFCLVIKRRSDTFDNLGRSGAGKGQNTKRSQSCATSLGECTQTINKRISFPHKIQHFLANNPQSTITQQQRTQRQKGSSINQKQTTFGNSSQQHTVQQQHTGQSNKFPT